MGTAVCCFLCEFWLQLLHTVLGGVKASFDSVAWPRMTLAQRRNWTPAEDSLLWLGIIRCALGLTYP